MLLIIVPVIFLSLFFAWRYRQSNTTAVYEPEWDHSTQLELLIWGAPLLIIIALGLLTWINTHTLDPYRPLSRIDATHAIPAGTKPLEVEVVALDWKWLFIYPEQGIATVNELAAPVNVPVHFRITSSSVMNSFYIPALAGQIYAMPGMQTTLNAVINHTGEFDGFSANYSGAGFSDMRFKFHGMTQEDFAKWVESAKSGQGTLDKVAGPVGEALIMTATGLAVAIPAVLAYNAFTRSNRLVLAQLDAFAHDLFAILTTGSHYGVGASDGATIRTGAPAVRESARVVPLNPAGAA